MTEKSWVSREILFNEENKLLLDETYEKISYIPNLKTKLFLHQQTIVKAMVDLENNRLYNILQNNSIKHIKIDAGILSEPVGAGKTIDILSLILLQKTPRKYRTSGNINGLIYKKKYTRIFPQTIIFVGVSVLNQWEESIKKFTNLTFLSIKCVNDLDNLIDMIQFNHKELDIYDIILVKNGSISRLPINFNPGIIERENKSTKIYIMNVLSNYKTFAWSRVVIDDFDTIHMNPQSNILNSLFTWYVSSTTKQTYFYPCILNIIPKTTEDLLLYHRQQPNILLDTMMMNNFNIRNTDLFIKKSTNMKKPKFYVYVLVNPNNVIINMIQGIDIPDIKSIIEMLNSDSIESAAEKVGIKSNTVIGVFEHILGEQYNIFKESVMGLHFIRNQLENKEKWKPNINKLTYTKQNLLEFKPIEYKYNNINTLLNNAEIMFIENKIKAKKIIDRVRGNLQENECPICVTELSYTDMIIFKCCNLIMCGNCCKRSIFSNGNLQGSCCKCRTKITIKDLVYLNNVDLNYEELLENFTEENADIFLNENKEENDKEEKEENKEECKEECTKLSTVIDIILSRDIRYRKKANVDIKNLLSFNSTQDENEYEDEEKSYKKILIFANYDEILNKMAKLLEDNNIIFDILGGTYSQIDYIVKRFTTIQNDMVLIINSIKHCSGLNLQIATDIVFVHRIMNPSIESQVIGRGYRLGRTSTLNIHYVLYENEYNLLNQEGRIKYFN